MTQHAAALTMAAVLGQRLGIDPLPILAQDPIYSLVAKRLLKEEGIEVVGGRGSLAFTHVDENTLVFSCNSNIPVKQVVADIAKPAAMIWNRVRPAVDESTQWVRKVIQCKEVLFS
jgi:SRR1 domain